MIKINLFGWGYSRGEDKAEAKRESVCVEMKEVLGCWEDVCREANYVHWNQS